MRAQAKRVIRSYTEVNEPKVEIESEVPGVLRLNSDKW